MIRLPKLTVYIDSTPANWIVVNEWHTTKALIQT